MGYEYLGDSAKAFVAGKGVFADKFKEAKRPLIIVGSALVEHPDGATIISLPNS